jgi:ATP-dependent Clp protease, protease subunit
MAYKYVYVRTDKNKSENEIDDTEELKFPFGEIEKKPYKQFNQVLASEHVHFYLSKTIGEPEGYTDMIHRITHAQPSDVIFIHLNTPGGQLDTGVQLINAMRNSQAKVVTVLESCAYSLGTLIFLCGDEMVINEHCMMMFHNFNGGLIGKGNELVSELEATVKWFAALAEDIYIPFLTRDEFNRIARGEDMWMQTPEIKQRLERMVKAMQDKEKAEEKAELERTRDQLLALAGEIQKKTEKKAAKKTAAEVPPVAPAKKTRTPRKAKAEV